MRTSKKLLALLLCVAMIAAMGIPALAADPTVSASSVTAHRGDTVDVTIDLKNNPGIIALQVKVGYDATALELLGVTDAKKIGAGTLEADYTKNPYMLTWCDGTAPSNYVFDDTVATLSFKVKDDAAYGDYAITVSVVDENTLDYNTDPVAFTPVNGSVTVEEIVCPHTNTETVAGKAATCAEDGLTDGVKCTDCGTWVTPQTVIPATGIHTPETVPGKAATCTEAGLTDGQKCSVCGAEITAQEAIPALNHANAVYVAAKDATCVEDGNIACWSCEDCGEYFSDEGCIYSISADTVIIPAFGHTVVIDPAVDPIDDQPGWTEGSHCSVCGEILVPQMPISNYIPEDETPINGKSKKTEESEEPEEPEEPAESGDLKFIDVAKDAWYYDAVYWAVENNITVGTSETTFSPEEPCTRAQIVTFLWRAAGCPEPASTENPFADVAADTYYTKAVLWAVENGITVGTGEGAFSPNAVCTRGQIVTFLARFAKAENTAAADCFEDVAADAYYAGAVTWAADNGITVGTSETTFSPDNECTRAQIVTFLYRYFAE